jgi:hypothetical protein
MNPPDDYVVGVFPRPVSKQVSSARNNGAELLEAVG